MDSANTGKGTAEALMETIAPDYVTARNVGKPLNFLTTNKTQNVWFSFACRPRAYWVAGGRRMNGPVTTDDYLPMDVFPGCPTGLRVLVPKLPLHGRPTALRLVVLESGVAEHVVCDIPFR